ncbi:MAG: hypothetical protein LBR92_01525 [Puniceicoccales bacterium]|jgi:hypothetical protein|nr:hypothetical protein [Puniceicoccales bacterium]
MEKKLLISVIFALTTSNIILAANDAPKEEPILLPQEQQQFPVEYSPEYPEYIDESTEYFDESFSQ